MGNTTRARPTDLQTTYGAHVHIPQVRSSPIGTVKQLPNADRDMDNQSGELSFHNRTPLWNQLRKILQTAGLRELAANPERSDR